MTTLFGLLVSLAFTVVVSAASFSRGRAAVFGATLWRASPLVALMPTAVAVTRAAASTTTLTLLVVRLLNGPELVHVLNIHSDFDKMTAYLIRKDRNLRLLSNLISIYTLKISEGSV